MARLYVVFVGVLLLHPGASYAQIDYSFSAGPNFTTLEVDFQNIQNPQYDAVLGFYASLYGGLSFGPVSVHGGAMFVNAGAIFDGSDFLDKDNFDVNFITIPVDVRVFLPLSPIAQPYLAGGGELRYRLDLSDADADFEEALSRRSAAASIGVGVRFSAPILGISLSPELRYAIDLEGLTDGDLTLRDEVVRIRKEFRADMLRLGLVVGL